MINHVFVAYLLYVGTIRALRSDLLLSLPSVFTHVFRAPLTPTALVHLCFISVVLWFNSSGFYQGACCEVGVQLYFPFPHGQPTGPIPSVNQRTYPSFPDVKCYLHHTPFKHTWNIDPLCSWAPFTCHLSFRVFLLTRLTS